MTNRIRTTFLLFLLIIPVITVYSLSQKDADFIKKSIVILNDKVPSEHPRILILKSEINSLKQFYNEMKDDKDIGYVFKEAVFDKFGIVLTKEPQRLPDGNDYNKRQLWREAYDNAFNTAMNAQKYAFSYLLTGDEKYGREAAKWLIHLAGWDVNGGIDIKNNDEAFIQSLRPMIIAYDWAYDALKPEERKIIENALKSRLDILLNHITSVYSAFVPLPIEKGDSHKMRFISTLGLGGLALYRELKNADVYLAWSYEYYLNQFPVWGGNDGGYSEGLNYWTTGHNQHFMFIDSMKVLGLNGLTDKEYFKNNGYFGLYNIMPYPFSSFGDLCGTVKPNDDMAMHIEKYALIYKDPYLMKFRDLIFLKYPDKAKYYEYSYFDSIFQLFRKKNIDFKQVSFADLPRSKFFRDIGWVAMHSEIGNRDNDIMLGFKSSPYGSHSHSFADQNSFVINAYGEMLAISSGYREWYGSPHHYGWNKSTISKNAVLFDNKGQEINNPGAKGAITEFYSGRNFDFTTGDALPAYKTMVYTAEKALRTILFVNKRYFMIFDEISGSVPLKHQWMLHAKNEMTINYKDQEVTINGKNVKLLTRFVYPDKKEFTFSQTNQFTHPVHESYAKRYPEEWHFKLNAKSPAKDRNYIAFIYPYRNTDAVMPETVLSNAENGFAVNCTYADTKDLIIFSFDAGRQVKFSDNQFKGKCFVISKDKEMKRILMIKSASFENNEFFINSEYPANIEIEIMKDRMLINAFSDRQTKIKIKTEFDPVKISGADKSAFYYNSAEKTFEFTVNGKINIILEN